MAEEFRKQLGAVKHDDGSEIVFPDEITMGRFMTARKGDIVKAVLMYSNGSSAIIYVFFFFFFFF